MIDRLLKPIDWVKKTHDWLLEGNPRQSPIKKRWVTSGRERVQIVIIRGFSALYSLLWAILLEIYSILAEFVIGILKDMWESDRKHTQDIILNIVSGILFVIKETTSLITQIGCFLFNLLRR